MSEESMSKYPDSQCSNYELEVSHTNVGPNYESFFDQPKSVTSDRSYVQTNRSLNDSSRRVQNVSSNRSYNIPRPESANKYRPFGSRFTSNVAKVKNIPQNSKNRPPVPHTTHTLYENKTSGRTSKADISRDSGGYSSTTRQSHSQMSFTDNQENKNPNNMVASPNMQFFNKSKQITQDMQSRVMSMIESRNKTKKVIRILTAVG